MEEQYFSFLAFCFVSLMRNTENGGKKQPGKWISLSGARSGLARAEREGIMPCIV